MAMIERCEVETLRDLKSILGRDGVRAAVIFLNSKTDHRYTALYRFDRETLCNLYFVDKENPSRESIEDIPVSASYCAFVRRNDGTFTVSNSIEDARLEHHAKRNIVRAYCGVPLHDEAGKVFGTICHFDFQPMSITDSNFGLMEALAPLLMHEHSEPIS